MGERARRAGDGLTKSSGEVDWVPAWSRPLASLAFGAGMTEVGDGSRVPTSSRAGLRRSAPWAEGTGPMHLSITHR